VRGLDPTGREHLERAEQIRKRLRLLLNRKRQLTPIAAGAILAKVVPELKAHVSAPTAERTVRGVRIARGSGARRRWLDDAALSEVGDAVPTIALATASLLIFSRRSTRARCAR
jgi:hypothetical protein